MHIDEYLAREPLDVKKQQVVCEEQKIMSTMTLHIQVLVKKHWRVTLGLLAFRFGCWITGMGIEVTDNE